MLESRGKLTALAAAQLRDAIKSREAGDHLTLAARAAFALLLAAPLALALGAALPDPTSPTSAFMTRGLAIATCMALAALHLAVFEVYAPLVAPLFITLPLLAFDLATLVAAHAALSAATDLWLIAFIVAALLPRTFALVLLIRRLGYSPRT